MFRARLRHPRLFLAAFALLGAVAVMIFLLSSRGRSWPEYPYTVQTFEDQGNAHLEPGETYDQYNSNPPTSGPHAPKPADWGVHDERVPKEALVHNMEHGGVVIWYDCSAGAAPLDEAQCRELRDQLAAVAERNSEDGKRVAMVPYAGMDHRIALTAWRTLDAFDQFDGERVQAFIDSFEGRLGPEA